jgi:hypothetical protein
MESSHSSKSGKPGPGDPEVSEADLVWLACAIDSEGCMSTYPVGPARKPFEQLSVANSNWDFIQKVKDLFNRITGRHVRAHRTNGKRQACWTVQLSGAGAVSILRAVRPWLVAKPAQAALLISIRDRAPRPSRTWPPVFAEMAAAVRWLNHHYPQPDDPPETVETRRRAAALAAEGRVQSPEESGR